MAFFADPDGDALLLHHRYAPRESQTGLAAERGERVADP